LPGAGGLRHHGGMAKQTKYSGNILAFKDAIHKALVNGVPESELGAAFASMICAHGVLRVVQQTAALTPAEYRHKYGRIAEPNGKGGARMVVPKARAAKAGK